MASDIWLRTILIVREETRCRHIGYSFRVTARVLLYAPSHRQDSTYHLCYTSRGALLITTYFLLLTLNICFFFISRYNPSDLAPLDTISPNELEQFYTDYNKLTKLIRDPANCFRVKLNPGMLLLLNNWRVLHARDSFTGDRALFGCYISHDDWMSKARLLGLA